MVHGYRERAEQGQGLIRLTMFLLVLLIAATGIFDLGRLYCSYIAVTNAAEEGAAYAAMHPGDTNGIIARVQAVTDGVVEIDRSQVEVYSPLGVPRAVGVAISYRFIMVTPLVGTILPDGGLILRAAAIRPISGR